MTSSFDSDEEESETDQKLSSQADESKQLRDDGFTTVDVPREAIEEFVK